MVITAIRFIRPHNIRTEVAAEIVLVERQDPVPGMGIERHVVNFAQEQVEITALFTPRSNTLSLQLVQNEEAIAHFVVGCATPCELTFRLPSGQRVGFFCDPKQSTARSLHAA